MSPRVNQTHIRAATLAASLVLAPALMLAADNTSQTAGGQTTARRKAVASRRLPSRTNPAARSLSRSGARTSRAKSKTRRRISDRQRRAMLRPQSGRIQEIQQALIQAGYLHAEASGRWDDPTRDAMRRYQKDHGFPPTGLPEAKSLMKLGLGPHPLPRELDPSEVAQASAAGAGTTDAPSATSSSSSHSPDSVAPPQK